MPVLLAAALIGAGANAAGDGRPGETQDALPAAAMAGVVQTAASGNTAQAAARAAKVAVDYWLPAVGDGLPEWMRRFEFEWDIEEDIKPEFSLLTVQPLFQTPDMRDTFFTQFRVARNRQFGGTRTTTNLGFGYRRLLLDNTLLAGLNAFHDFEWNFNHSRASLGGELRWSGFDLYTNKYWAVSGKHTADSGAAERPLDGFDMELTAQVPYLPWARARARRVWWDAVDASEDVKG